MLPETGSWRYRIAAWTDHCGTWRRDMERRLQAGQVEDGDVLEGLALIEAAMASMGEAEATQVSHLISAARDAAEAIEAGRLLMDDQILDLLTCYPDRANTALSHELTITVDPVPARFSAWYELFPRSQGDPGR